MPFGRLVGAAVLPAALLLASSGCVSEAEAARETLQQADELREDGETAQAAAQYEAAAELDPSLAEAYGALAAIRLEQRRYGQARRLAERAVELAPNDAAHHETLGVALVHLERWAQARTALLQALSLDPEREHLHQPLGRARLETGDREGALRSWKRVLELEPRDADVRLSVVKLLVEQLEARLETRDARRQSDDAPPTAQQYRASRMEMIALRDEAQAMLAAVNERALDGDGASRLGAIEERLTKAAARIDEGREAVLAQLRGSGSSHSFGLGRARVQGGAVTAGGGTGSGGRFTIRGSLGGQGSIGLLRALGGGGSGSRQGPSVQATTHGGYPEASARRVAEGHGPALQLCYELRRRAGTAAQGAVVATVEVDTGGRVTHVTARDDGTGDAAVVQCVRGLVQRWRFPAPSSAVTIELRLDFSSQAP